MAQAQRKATQVAKSIKPAATDSTIANLPGKTTTATVRAAVSGALKTGPNFTAQYVYDRFVVNKADIKEDGAKMDVVRQMAEVLDVNGFDTIVSGMVKMANDAKTAAIDAAKAAGNYDSENPTWPIREATARLNTARAHQTQMRIGFGVLKFCAEELKAKLGDAALGYRMVREIGNKLLQDKGITWKGEKVQPRETPEAKQARQMQETETAAMLEVQKANPRKPNEDRGTYYARIAKETEAKLSQIEADNKVKQLADLAEKVRAMVGDNLPDIIDILLSADAKPEVKAEPKPTTPAADKNLH